eukprot:TRINITY_DN702_c0_g2_i1.p1 TRINITY_DN702_c0_g2~~TRINITY_DN702_c0_g2_i1.p1  ORF type:complete len:169 (+),score=17.60 TRINITY_DN702_c0_g2_i1:42-509(+)
MASPLHRYPPSLAARSLFYLAVVLLSSTAAVGKPCSNMELYVEWISQWAVDCRPKTADSSFSWFSSCDWVGCQCLWGGLSAPVATDEIAPCFTQALEANMLKQDVKWFSTALMRTCKSYSQELSKPCGRCDKFRNFRVGKDKCSDTGLANSTSSV